MKEELKENHDLLTANWRNKKSTHRHQQPDNSIDNPPDGGLRAIAVALASFFINGLMFGVVNSYSVIHFELRHQLKENGDPHAESKASLVGSLTMGTTFFLSPVSGIVAAFLGLRKTAVFGGLIATLSLVLSSFVTPNVTALCFCYGILYGLGISLAYTPSLAILSHYYKKYLSRVNGFVTIGSSVFSVFIPMLMEHVIKNYSLIWLFRVLAVLTFGVSLCGLLFKPIPVNNLEKKVEGTNFFKKLFNVILDVHIWRKIQYRIWALSVPVALFGYFIPYVNMKAFTESKFQNSNPNLPLQCIVASSGIGRLLFGFLGDRPNVDRIHLQQISFYVIGILTIILPFISSFPWVVVLSLCMGLFDGAFIALIGPIAVELCGNKYAGEAIGTMFGMAALPLSIGPLVAGYIREHFNTYTLTFVMSGISPLVGATLMFAIRHQGRRHENKQKMIQNEEQSGPLQDLQVSNGLIQQDQTTL